MLWLNSNAYSIMLSFTKVNTKTKSFIKQFFSISNEFYYFLIALFIFNTHIWFTLQYHDEFISPLTQQSIQSMTSASFEDSIFRISPYFTQFEKNCRKIYQDYTLDAWTYIVSVLSMDWNFRLIYLFALYHIAVYFENKYQCKLKKFVSNHLISIITQQSIKYKTLCRLLQFLLNSFLFFCLSMLDVMYTRFKYTNGSEQIDPALMDYSDIAFMDRIKDFIYIFIRVHPTDSWLVRISHGVSYPFTLYALSRRSVSDFIYVHMLTIALWAFHIGGLAHTLTDRDMQLRCVRRSFIWSTRGTSIHGEAMRIVAAPYLNLVCLTINCVKYIL